jgi:hypothetical protein
MTRTNPAIAALRHHVSGAIARGEAAPIVAIEEMDSAEMARRLALNPHNVGGIPGAPRMSTHDVTAARFEAEGRAAYPHGRNPYNAGTMAHERWARGWHQRFEA